MAFNPSEMILQQMRDIGKPLVSKQTTELTGGEGFDIGSLILLLLFSGVLPGILGGKGLGGSPGIGGGGVPSAGTTGQAFSFPPIDLTSASSMMNPGMADFLRALGMR